jgi:hypothetical protein
MLDLLIADDYPDTALSLGPSLHAELLCGGPLGAYR